MLRWIIMLALLLGMGYWALMEKDEKVFKQDGVELPWSIDQLKKVYRITLTQADKKITVIRHTTGMWWLAEPEMGMANQFKISVWLNTLMMPKVMRWISPDETQKKLIENALTLELEYGKDKTHLVKYFEVKNRKDSVYFYLPKLKKLLVIELHEPFGDQLLLTDYRTIRIFPFRPNATLEMKYQVGDVIHTLKKTENGWEIDFQMNDIWKNLLRKMYNAASKGFVEGRIEGERLASWEFTYESGDRSKLELFLTEKGYVAYYRGRDIGQIIDQKEVNNFFPQVLGN